MWLTILPNTTNANKHLVLVGSLKQQLVVTHTSQMCETKIKSHPSRHTQEVWDLEVSRALLVGVSSQRRHVDNAEPTTQEHQRRVSGSCRLRYMYQQAERVADSARGWRGHTAVDHGGVAGSGPSCVG